MRIRADDLSGTPFLFVRGVAFADGYYSFIRPTGSIEFYTNQGAARQLSATSAGDILINNCYTMGISRSGASIRLYVNGLDVTNVAGTHINPLTCARAAKIGIHDDLTSFPFDGKIEFLSISGNVALTPSWHLTFHNTISSPATFYSVGSLVTLVNPTMGVPTNPTIDGTSATLIGSITDTGFPDGDDCSEYGFVWDTVTHANPGDVAPDATDYASYWSSTSGTGVGTFTHTITGLTELTTYCFRAYALSAGYTYSEEICFFITEEGKVYIELRPDLDETLIRGQAGVPTDIAVGGFNGYSLPIWNEDNEELHYIVCVPSRWDGISDILLHIDSALTTANQDGLAYNWELLWEHFSPNEDVVPATANTITKERAVYSDIQYNSYQDWLIIDYNIDVDDVIEPDDLIAVTLRRTGAKAQNDTDEIIVFAIDVLFARGDFLADPVGNVNILIEIYAAAEGWIGDADMVFFALIFLCLGLMIGGYALHRSSFAFMGMAAWMALLVYCRIESAGEWGIYMAVFWLCFAGIVICGIEGVMLNRGEEAAEDEARYTSALDEAYSDMDEKLDEKRKNRRMFQ